jgi:hypothetical protein
MKARSYPTLFAPVCPLLCLQAAAQPAGLTSLTPKADVSEHWVIVGTPPEVWSVKDGVIACAGEPRGLSPQQGEVQELRVSGGMEI